MNAAQATLVLLGVAACAVAPLPQAAALGPTAAAHGAALHARARPVGEVTASHALALWLEGDVRLSSDPSAAARGPAPDDVQRPLGDPLYIGDPVTAGDTLIVPADARALILLDGHRVARIAGPARHHFTGAALSRRDGPAASVTALDGFRERPDAPSPNLHYLPPAPRPEPEVGLALTAPPPTLSRDPDPLVRWRWSGADDRFDLSLARLDDADELTVVERWRGLAGRSLRLWAPLEPGARYRVTITLRGARPFSRVIVDQVDFALLDDVARRAVEGSLAALGALLRPGDPVRPELEVLRARLLERYGLLAEAERVWAALSLLHPDRLEPRHHARRLHAELARPAAR